MYAKDFPPLTFADLSASVARGFGQAPGSCLDYDASGNCTAYESSYPIIVDPSTAQQMNQAGDLFPVGTVNVATPTPASGLTIGGMTIPTGVLIAAALLGGVVLLGGIAGRR